MLVYLGAKRLFPETNWVIRAGSVIIFHYAVDKAEKDNHTSPF